MITKWVLNRKIKKAKALLQEADAILVVAGNNMNSEGRIYEFQKFEGLLKDIQGIRNLKYEDLFSPQWFDIDPKMAWAVYGYIYEIIKNRKVPEGYILLKKFLRSKKFFIYTTCIDGLFMKAGFPENKIVESNGNIHYLQCVKPCKTEIWKAVNLDVKIDMKTFEALEPLPRCKYCGGIARPNILLFNDIYWVSTRTEFQRMFYRYWLNKVTESKYKFVILELDAGTEPLSPRLQTERILSLYGGRLIRINENNCKVSSREDIGLPMSGEEGLKLLLNEDS